MAWIEARSGASTTTRHLAHEDRAKDRRDETDRPRVRPRWLWPVVVGVLLVLVAGASAAALRSRSDSPDGPRAASKVSPSATESRPTATPTAQEPLAGSYTVSGPVVSTSRIGTRWSFRMTARMRCSTACRVTVLKVPAQYLISARAYVQRTFTPAGPGVYRFVLDEPLTRSGGEVLPGCEALRVRGAGTLRRNGDSITITTQHEGDQLPGSGGNRCTLADRTFVFTGALS